ncbi:MAG: GumN family protein [Methyloligella sp.]|nr:MAG: GumN family protein [Methyloligella sp.]
MVHSFLLRTPFYLKCFFLSLFCLFSLSTLAFAEAPQAQLKQLPTCKGVNLVEEMRIIEPERYQKLKRVADIEKNSDAVLWRIDGTDGAPSYLFGTMHTTDPEVTQFSEQAKTAFTEAKAVAVEVANLEPAQIQSYIQKNPEQFFSLKGPKLNDYLSQDDYSYVIDLAVKQGMPKNMIPLLKPWFAYISYFQIPGCEAFRMSKGLVSLDQHIIKKAKLSGKRLIGLESLNDQFSAFDALAPKHQVTLLQDGIFQHKRINDFYFTAMQLYKSRQIGMMIPLSIAFGKNEEKTTAAMAEFLEIMVVKRNKQMFEHSLPLVKKGGAFIAVGALHMTGRHGLVEAFRSAGYDVTKIN